MKERREEEGKTWLKIKKAKNRCHRFDIPFWKRAEIFENGQDGGVCKKISCDITGSIFYWRHNKCSEFCYYYFEMVIVNCIFLLKLWIQSSWLDESCKTSNGNVGACSGIDYEWRFKRFRWWTEKRSKHFQCPFFGISYQKCGERRAFQSSILSQKQRFRREAEVDNDDEEDIEEDKVTNFPFCRHCSVFKPD